MGLTGSAGGKLNHPLIRVADQNNCGIIDTFVLIHQGFQDLLFLLLQYVP